MPNNKEINARVTDITILKDLIWTMTKYRTNNFHQEDIFFNIQNRQRAKYSV